MLCYDKINDHVHDDDDNDNDDHVMITDSKGLNLLILMVNEIKVFHFLKVTLSKGQLKILITYVLTCSMKSNQIIEIIFQSKNLKYFYVSKVNGHKLDRITILKIYIN